MTIRVRDLFILNLKSDKLSMNIWQVINENKSKGIFHNIFNHFEFWYSQISWINHINCSIPRLAALTTWYNLVFPD